MYSKCLLLTWLACIREGRRVRAAYEEDISRQDLKGFHVPESTPDSLKAIPTILLSMFNPPAGYATRGALGAHTAARPPRKNSRRSTHAMPFVVMSSGADVSNRDEVSGEATVRAVVSVDWEGDLLLNENLAAIKDFHAAHPDVPLTHFLNAAYFTKPGQGFLKRGSREWFPMSALRPIDENGLHLHGWRSLVRSSDVEFRSEPNFMPEENRDAFDTDDPGIDVDMRAYTVPELQAIIAKSKEILEDHGMELGKSFRTGAWLGGPNVLEAARREGFLLDSSAVNTDLLVRRLDGKAFLSMVRELWPRITNRSQPFHIDTPAGQILQMPNTGALADYTTVEEMIDHIDNAVEELDSEDRFVHIGFHQETAEEFAPRVVEVINEIKRKHGHRVVFETLEASAQRAISSLQSKDSKSNVENAATVSSSSEVEAEKRTKRRRGRPKHSQKVEAKRAKRRERRERGRQKGSKKKRNTELLGPSPHDIEEAIDIVLANMGGQRKRNTIRAEDDRTLYVSDLPEVADELYVYKVFSSFGALENVLVKTGFDGRGSVAFVQYRTEKDAVAALQGLDNLELPDGHVLRVSACENYSAQLLGDIVGKVVPVSSSSSSGSQTRSYLSSTMAK